MKLVRSFLRWCLPLVAVWLIVSASIGIVAVEGALHPMRRALSPHAVAIAQSIAGQNHAQFAEVSIVSADGKTLRAWNIRPQHGNGNAVILLHGQSDNRVGMLGNAELLLDLGYAVLLPDARAHGESGGDVATYGVEEADDIRRWFGWLQHSQSPACIYGLGDSMGAAQLLQSLPITPGFCAVVAESPFASFREAAYLRIGQEFGAGPWLGRTLLRPAVETGLLYAHWKYGVDLSHASPEQAVALSRVPVLLIHGRKDTNLPPRNSEEILAYNARRAPPVVLWEPPDAGHCGAAAAEPEEYERHVIGWFESHSSAARLAQQP